MITSIRRENQFVEDLHCPQCDRPLLSKNSPCRFCQTASRTIEPTNLRRQNTVRTFEHTAEEPVMNEVDEPVITHSLYENEPAPGSKLYQNYATPARAHSPFNLILRILLITVGSLGLIFAAFKLVDFDLFQGFTTTGLSLMLLSTNQLLAQRHK